jgi:hypothetical protein
MICDYCGEDKPDVQYRQCGLCGDDPYGWAQREAVCDDCEAEHCQDI